MILARKNTKKKNDLQVLPKKRKITPKELLKKSIPKRVTYDKFN